MLRVIVDKIDSDDDDYAYHNRNHAVHRATKYPDDALQLRQSLRRVYTDHNCDSEDDKDDEHRLIRRCLSRSWD